MVLGKGGRARAAGAASGGRRGGGALLPAAGRLPARCRAERRGLGGAPAVARLPGAPFPRRLKALKAS